MSSEVDTLIQLGGDIIKFKYYGLATCTILFYDYFLTLSDEVEYIWSGTKSWTFWLFIVNRYLPMTDQFWQLAVSYGPQSPLNTKVCDNSTWFPNLMFNACTTLAQVMMTLRIYAITSRNILITAVFAVITSCQFVFGITSLIMMASKGAQQFPQIPLDAFHLCAFVAERPRNIAYAAITLLHDLLAFSLIIFLAKRSKSPGTGLPTLWVIIARDATRYFFVIFTTHLVLEMGLVFGHGLAQYITAPGVVVYLPVMISRIVLSLRKAADPRVRHWSITEPTADDATFLSLRFFRPQKRQDMTLGGREVIPLEGRDEALLSRGQSEVPVDTCLRV